jgi:enoyl-CoA hydratase/carnithine racemase
MEEQVTYETRDGIVWLTLSRPSKLNSLTLAGWRGIADGLARAAEESPAPVVLTGAGSAFCAGDDIPSFNRVSTDRRRAEEFFVDGLYGTIEAIVTHPTPVIAAVNGIAYGGGLELVAAADLAISAASARYSIPEGRLGVFAAVFGGLAPTMFGYKQANAVAYTMPVLTPADALALGLVNTVVPDADLNAEVNDLIRDMLASSPQSLSQTKRLLSAEARERGLPRVKASLQTLVDDFLGTENVVQGTNAFVEKRRPDFGWGSASRE